MTKYSVGMFLNVGLDLIPIAFIIAYLFAGRANGQYPSQCLDFCQGVLKFQNKLLSLLLHPLALGDVTDDNGEKDLIF